MSIDAGKIGQAAASLMDRVEADHPDGELVDVLVIVEVGLDPNANGGHDLAAFRWAGSSGRASVDAGLCAQALEGLTNSGPGEVD